MLAVKLVVTIYWILGVKSAAAEFGQNGYQLVYKVFRYHRNNPLEVFDSTAKIKKWQPDLVIGPRNSNMFLLIQHQFTHTLVLSSFSTSNAVEKMPSNYYSLMFPDQYMAKAMYRYVAKNYPDKKVYAIVKADCKNCMDISNNFAYYYNSTHTLPMIRKFYAGEKIDQSDIARLMADYQKGDIIFLPNTAYTSALLMAQITNYIKHKVLFLGGDDWGAWKDTETGKIKAKYAYEALHFTPVSINFRQSEYYTCSMQKATVSSNVYYTLAYNTLSSVLQALGRFNSNTQEMSLRARILYSYQSAIKTCNHWYRPKRYFIYKIAHEKETFLTSIPVFINRSSYS